MRNPIPLLLLTLAAAGCGNGGARLDHARSLLEKDRFAEARDALVAAHTTRPTSMPAAVLLARAQRECGRPEEAVAVLLRVRDQDAGNEEVREEKIRALHDRALIHRMYDRDVAAARDMEDASELARGLADSPRKVSRLLLLAGRIELVRGRRGEARTWLEEARLAGADAVECDSLEALALAQSGSLAEATKRMMALTRSHPDHADALWTLAMLLRSAGNRVEARPLLERARAADPLHPRAGVDLANILRELGDEEAAANASRAFLEHRPDHVDALRTLARARGAQGRWTDAIEALRHAADTHVRDVDVLNELGMALAEGAGWKNERLSEAIRVHEKALAIDPRHVGNAYNLARCIVVWNRPEKLERAVEIYEGLLIRIQGQRKWQSLTRDIHGNVAVVLSDSFKRWERAYPHYKAYFEMGGEVTKDFLDEWGKVLEGLGQPFREPPRPGR